MKAGKKEIVISQAAHSGGFNAFAFAVEPGVLPREASPGHIMFVRDLLGKAKTVSALVKTVSSLDAQIERKFPGVSFQVKGEMKNAAEAYLLKVCKVMQVENPLRARS